MSATRAIRRFSCDDAPTRPPLTEEREKPRNFSAGPVVQLGMGSRPRPMTTAMLLFVGMLCVGCGTDRGKEARIVSAPAESKGDDASMVSCTSDHDQILDLLRSGLPTYDYRPATDLRALVNDSDVVLTGTMSRITRASDVGGSHGEQRTVIRVGSPEVLHSALGLDAPITEFAYPSLWTQGGEPDPLANPVNVKDVHFLAFLHRWEGEPGRFVAGIQGLFVSCDGGVPPEAIVEPLPTDGAGVPFNELLAMVGGENPAATSPTAMIMSAAALQLVTVDHTFGIGRPSPFSTFLVQTRTDPGAGAVGPDGRGNGDTSRPLTLLERTAIKQRLSPLGEVKWIEDPAEYQSPELSPTISGSVIIGLGEPTVEGDSALAPVSMWCGNQCGTWFTYRLAHDSTGTWMTVGTEGPIAIS